MNQPFLFEIETPLKFVVKCTQDRWAEILVKHAVMDERLEDVKRTLSTPDEIRQSGHDETVALFYKTDEKRYVCVLVNRVTGVLITAYPTDAVKKGTVLWSK